MNRALETELMRLLHGELPDEQARALRDRLGREPDLAAAWARLERTWSGLELPPAAAAPPGLAQRVLARARREAVAADNGLSWSAAPTWVRASAAAALAAGLALGIGGAVGTGLGAGLGAGLGSGSRTAARLQEPDEAVSVITGSSAAPSLAETYWDALEDLDSTSPDTDGEPL